MANAQALQDRRVFHDESCDRSHYVKLGGNSVADAGKVLTAVTADLAAMDATATALTAKINFAQAQVTLTKVQLSAAQTALARTMSDLEASAAQLAYEAQALATTGDLTAAQRRSTTLRRR